MKTKFPLGVALLIGVVAVAPMPTNAAPRTPSGFDLAGRIEAMGRGLSETNWDPTGAAQGAYLGPSCIYVSRNGEKVGEWNYGTHTSTTAAHVASISKSISALLIGIAQRKGVLSIDQKVSDFLPAWRNTTSADVTIRHLLSMTSGRTYTNFDLPTLVLTPRAKSTSAAAGTQSATPGTVWLYNDNGVQILEAVLTSALGLADTAGPSGDNVGSWARKNFFEPLGVTATATYGVNEPSVAGMYAGWLLTCEGANILGQLMMNKGMWKGTRIIEESYVNQVLTPSSTLNPGYGFLWWLNTPDTNNLNYRNTLPTNMYWAAGACHNLSIVFPDSSLVVTMLRSTCGTDIQKVIADSNRDKAITSAGRLQMRDVFFKELAPIYSEYATSVASFGVSGQQLKVGGKIALVDVAKHLGRTPDVKDTVKLQVAATSAKVCRVRGKRVEAIKTGRCRVTVQVLNRTTVKWSRTVTFTATR